MKKPTIDVILLMAGNSTRFNSESDVKENKNLYQLQDIPLFWYPLQTFCNIDKINKIWLVVRKEEYNEVANMIINNNIDDKKSIELVIGGHTRAKSVQKALKMIQSDYVLIHDSARILIHQEDIQQLINEVMIQKAVCGSLYHNVTDTIKNDYNGKITTLNRDCLKAVTTPQMFAKDVYPLLLHNQQLLITDELSLVENIYQPILVKEQHPNLKITTLEDLEYVKYLLSQGQNYKIGHSFDYHNFSKQGPLILGGVKIQTDFGLEGWSDADVVYHVVCESLIGALGMGDIGTLFPDKTVENYQRDSSEFVKIVMEHLKEQGYRVKNIDVIIYLEKPNLKNYKPLISHNIQTLTECEYVNVKATTMEKQGLVGTSQGISAEAVVLIVKTQ